MNKYIKFSLLLISIFCINASTLIVAGNNGKLIAQTVDNDSIDPSIGLVMLFSILLLPAIVFISRLFFKSKTQKLTNFKKIAIIISYSVGFFISIDEGVYWFKLNFYSIAVSYFILFTLLIFCLITDLSPWIKSKPEENSSI
jgi:hypothetical protein